jgi:hypothetical protein
MSKPLLDSMSRALRYLRLAQGSEGNRMDINDAIFHLEEGIKSFQPEARECKKCDYPNCYCHASPNAAVGSQEK